MLKIEVTAPGKAILHGEHAVVYGKAAIATSLGLKTRVTYIPLTGTTVELKLELLSCQLQWNLDTLKSLKLRSEGVTEADTVLPPSEEQLKEISEFLKETDSLPENCDDFQKIGVTIFLYLHMSIRSKYGSGISEAFTLKAESELPIGAGMGSSAAYSVCLAAALLAACGKVSQPLSAVDMELVSRWAFCAETICHGSPSGIDNSICTYGGALFFQDGKIGSMLSSMPPLKVLVVNSGVPRNTKALVAKVKEKMKKHPTVISRIMDAINAISLESWDLLQNVGESRSMNEYLPCLQELIKMNQHLLCSLGVSHRHLDVICETAAKHCCVAKLTGAGGGGCAIIVSSPEQAGGGEAMGALKDNLTSLGYQYWDVALGGSGVQVNILS